MKKKDIILISIIVVLAISLIVTIIYYNTNKSNILTTEAKILAVGEHYLLVSTNDNIDYIINIDKIDKYQVGDKLKLELTNIDKKEKPYTATSKNIVIIESSEVQENSNETNKENSQETSNNNTQQEQESNKFNNNNQTNKKEEYTDAQIITYFENLNNELTTYENDQTLSETIKSKFVTCIDFIFYNKEIGGKTFSELTNSTKLKILEICLAIDSKIDSKLPGYKESISLTYQNIKSKIIEKYLETTSSICANDPKLCITAKEGFNDLKYSFGITWDIIKDLAGSSVSKLKDWYEIWRYN